MTIEQQITWTVLPNGIDDDRRAHLSIFVSPRLNTNENLPRPILKQFDDFAAWPKMLVGLSFRLRMDSGWELELKPDLSALDPDLWSELFPKDTFVRPYKFPDYSERVLHTYPVRSVTAYLKNTYQTVGVTSPGELPGILTSTHPNQALSQLADELGRVLERKEQREKKGGGLKLRDPFEDEMHDLKVLVPGKLYATFSSQTEQDFYQVNRFYSRVEDDTEDYMEKPEPSLVPKPPDVPDLDFHQALSALGDQPGVLRALGIILDISLPVEKILDNGGGTQIWAEPLAGARPFAAYNQQLTPRTAIQLDERTFQAAPRHISLLSKGMLNLAGIDDNLNNPYPPFHLIEVDPDGMAIKALDFAGTLRRVTEKEGMTVGTDIPQEMGLPSLQSGGLALVANGRAFDLFQHFQTDKTNNTNLQANNLLLHADDLLRGYRVDIYDDLSGKWFSLMQRVGMVIFPEAAKELPVKDEGYIKAASTASKDDKDSDLYFHEAVFKWNGWSLAAGRPGKVIVRVEDPPGSGNIVEKVIPPSQLPDVKPAPLPFPMVTELKVTPGTLPSLRFGNAYRLRARTADLAGNGLPPEVKEDDLATEKVRYGRYEPIAPPTVVPRELPAEGESLERLVIRSNYGMTAEKYAADPQIAAITATKPYSKYRKANERHIAAPKTSQLMAEQHGMFDPFFAPGQYDNGYRIALKENGSFLDDKIWEPALNAYQPILPPGSVELVRMPEPAHDVQYALHHEHPLRLPYLPDPLARGAAFRYLPDVIAGVAGLELVDLPDQSLVLKVPFDMKWPDSRPFLLRLEEKAGEMPDGTPQDACLEKFDTDPKPPSWDADQRILTVFLAKGEEVKVRYSTFPGVDANGKVDLELLSLWYWMLEHPAADPGLLERYAFNGAHWMISPYRTLSLVHAVQQPLCEPVIDRLGWNRTEGQTFVTLGGRFILNAKSTGKLDLQAEWQEPVDDLTEEKYKIVSGKAHAFELRIDYTFPNTLGDKLWENKRHEFGDTRHRYVSYHLEATTRYREYFPPEITSDPKNIQRIGPLQAIHVPSSVRPPALKPLYILPTYRWVDDLPREPEVKWEEMTRTRFGNGLRLYLERPWFLTGDDEKLGLVLWPDPAGGFADFQKYVSLMGQDPIHSSNPPQAVLQLEHFTNRHAFSRTGVPLRELPGKNFNVAAFDVQYNEERNLWYADLLFDPQMSTSYYPFVRLALARYQYYSVQGVELSPVVLSDFIQLAPDRHLNIQLHNEQLFSFNLSGYGPGKRASNYVTVSVQTHDPGIPGELGWIEALNSGPMFGKPTSHPNHWYFAGKMALPAQRGSQPMRILVQEFETYVVDREYYFKWDATPKGSRVVYADAVEI
jgi:hypothetical protein